MNLEMEGMNKILAAKLLSSWHTLDSSA